MIDGQQLPRTMKTYRQDCYEWDDLDIWAFASRLVQEWETEATSAAGEYGGLDDEKYITAEAGAMRKRIAQLKAGLGQ
jgi:hypothetical protein